MKYFTPERYKRLQATGMQDMDAADADWEIAVTEYERHLETIRSDLPESVRHLLDDFSLHDAEVFFMGRKPATLFLHYALRPRPATFWC